MLFTQFEQIVNYIVTNKLLAFPVTTDNIFPIEYNEMSYRDYKDDKLHFYEFIFFIIKLYIHNVFVLFPIFLYFLWQHMNLQHHTKNITHQPFKLFPL